MKLARKIALATAFGICLVLIVDGYLRVQRQLALFETDIERDHLSIGRATAAAMTEAWLSYGETLAQDLIDRVSKRNGKVAIRWIKLQGANRSAVLNRLPADIRESVLKGRELSFVIRDKDGQKAVQTYVPVAPDGTLIGTIELVESLARQTQYVRNTVIRTIAMTAIMLLLMVGIIFALGFVIIGRPIARLVEKAKRVGEHDFTGRLDFTTHDEISELASEMDNMTARLNEAGKKIEVETAARLATLEQLRHADRLKTVGQLTIGVIHELGTPLTVVAGRAKMIVSGEVSGEESVECARIVVEQTERITKTIRQILDFARLKNQNKKAQDISEMARSMVQLLAPVAVKRGIYVSWEENQTETYAFVDPSQIQQVLANLIMNAIQATEPEGHVTIGIKSENAVPMYDEGAQEQPFWALYVRDEGIGIPPDVLPRIYEPFFTTKVSGQGTGLGLSISSEIAREHKGWIAVESTPERGSCFTLLLPMTDKQS